MTPRISTALRLVLFTSLPCWIQAEEIEFTVKAGPFERRNTPVTFALPAEAKRIYKSDSVQNLVATTPGGWSAPLQIDSDGNATFVLKQLAPGATLNLKWVQSARNQQSDKPLGDGVQVSKSADRLKVTAVGRPVMDYQMQPGPVPPGVGEQFRHGAHLHPVYTPAGRVITANHPPDHKWQRGIWFAWTDTEFEGRHPDFWNMGKDGGGKLTGEVRFDTLLSQWNGLVHGGFTSRHRWLDHTGKSEKEVLSETWRVLVYAGTPGLQLFDLTSSQQATGPNPLKLPKYHYGGLGVRGAAEWDPETKVQMLTSNGDNRLKGDNTKAKWVWLGGELQGGNPAGIAVLIHPANFRFPQPLRLNPKNPQLCIAPSQAGDWEIKPGTSPYISRYRFVTSDTRQAAEELERLWNDYATPPEVNFTTSSK